MRQSTLFTKTRKEAPKDEVSLNAQLLIKAGFVHKEMAGVYSYLPLGFRVLKKIEQIIREEMNNIGAQEVFLTTLQDPKVWKASNRWQSEQESETGGLPWFKTKLANGNELGIANTHEEALANIMKHHVASYKDLPQYAYQIQTKFRNELRAKSGLMRGREFVMKDLYSFTRTQKELDEFYEKAAQAYINIFKRTGLGDKTYRTFASGGAFSKFSDEFQTLSEAGEDTIYIDYDKNIAVNKEVYTDEVLKELKLDKSKLKEAKSIEVGNIFKLGTKYAQAEGLVYLDEDGKKQFPVMGSYGIGLGRLMGAVVETSNDSAGIIWPAAIAPLAVHLLAVGDNEDVYKEAQKVYELLKENNIDVLYDDRADLSAGEKLKDADLLGIPARLVVSSKTMDKDGVELKWRDKKDTQIIPLKQVIKELEN